MLERTGNIGKIMKLEIYLCQACKDELEATGELYNITDEGIAFCWSCGEMLKEGNTNEIRSEGN